MEKDKAPSQQSLTPSHSHSTHQGDVIKVGIIITIILHVKCAIKFGALNIVQAGLGQSLIGGFASFFLRSWLSCIFKPFPVSQIACGCVIAGGSIGIVSHRSDGGAKYVGMAVVGWGDSSLLVHVPTVRKFCQNAHAPTRTGKWMRDCVECATQRIGCYVYCILHTSPWMKWMMAHFESPCHLMTCVSLSMVFVCKKTFCPTMWELWLWRIAMALENSQMYGHRQLANDYMWNELCSALRAHCIYGMRKP